MNARRFFDSPQFSDVIVQAAPTRVERDGKVITVDGRQYHAHRVILASASTYLEAMLTTPMKEGMTRHIILPTVTGEALNIALRSMYNVSYELPSIPEVSEENEPTYDCDALCSLFEEIHSLGYEKLYKDLWSKIVSAVWSSSSDVATHTAIFGLASKYNMMTPNFSISNDDTLAEFLLQCDYDVLAHVLRVTLNGHAWKNLLYWAALHPTIDVSKLVASIGDKLPVLSRETAPALESYVGVDNLSPFFAAVGRRQFTKVKAAGKRQDLIDCVKLKQRSVKKSTKDTPDPPPVEEECPAEECYEDDDEVIEKEGVDNMVEDAMPDEAESSGPTLCAYNLCMKICMDKCRSCNDHTCTAAGCRNVVARECTLCFNHIGVDKTTTSTRQCVVCGTNRIITGTKCCKSHVCDHDDCFAPTVDGRSTCSYHTPKPTHKAYAKSKAIARKKPETDSD